MNTVAGNGQSGYSGDNGLATAAIIKNPYGIVLDTSSTDVYFSDAGNFCIRKISKKSGIITTVAGTGTSGYSGDGAQATAAQISTAFGLAYDSSSGNFYIADSGNYVIRLVTKSTGIITTVAGTAGSSGYSGDNGQATLAKISYATDIALHASAGLLYIADSSNNVIRMITLSTGIISTVAGTGTSGFSGDNILATSAALSLPASVDIDPISGNIYIADSGNVVIKMVNKITGIITTVAGTGVAGYSGDSGQATSAKISYATAVRVDSSTGDVYIDDTDNCCIRVIRKKKGIINTVAGAGLKGCGYNGDGRRAIESYLKYPNSFAVNTEIGALYISDSGNNRIRAVLEKTDASSTKRPTASPITARPSRTSAPTGPTPFPTATPTGPSLFPTTRPTGPTASPTGPTVEPTRAPSGPGEQYTFSFTLLIRDGHDDNIRERISY